MTTRTVPFDDLLALAGAIEPVFVDEPDGFYAEALRIKEGLLNVTMVPAVTGDFPLHQDPFWEVVRLPLPLPRFKRVLRWRWAWE